MDGRHTQAVGEATGATGGDGAPPAVFINYRHEDADAAALLLYDRLVSSLGQANVFLDVKTLELGTRWLQEIKSRGARVGVVLALIGPGWLSSLKDRQPRAPDEPEDYVALELELALGRWPGRVIPVLISGATMPEAVQLPRPLRALAECQAIELRHESFDADVRALIEHLRALTRESGSRAPADGAREPPRREGIEPSARASREARRGAALDAGRGSGAAAVLSPDEDHFETVLECMVEEGSVVPILGSRLRGALPDATELAAHLAEKFNLGFESLDLAEVAQHVAVAQGPSFLHRAMKDALRLEPDPSEAHRFLARFPRRLADLKKPPRYQLIVSTNYDMALERAFDLEGEPYDLAVFVAHPREKGQFVHVPWHDEPRPITEPSRYRDFPIDAYDELERTVIVKILGAAEGGEGGYRWDRGYVVTEDNYIDYLVTDQIGSVVPLQILNKLTSSHCLFLGYAMRDWSLRVFLKRVWQGMPLEDKSWAIENEPDALEKDFWKTLHVELLSAPPDDYVTEIDARLGASSTAA